jgi:hypothetical protein
MTAEKELGTYTELLLGGPFLGDVSLLGGLGSLRFLNSSSSSSSFGVTVPKGLSKVSATIFGLEKVTSFDLFLGSS